MFTHTHTVSANSVFNYASACFPLSPLLLLPSLLHHPSEPLLLHCHQHTGLHRLICLCQSLCHLTFSLSFWKGHLVIVASCVIAPHPHTHPLSFSGLSIISLSAFSLFVINLIIIFLLLPLLDYDQKKTSDVKGTVVNMMAWVEGYRIGLSGALLFVFITWCILTLYLCYCYKARTTGPNQGETCLTSYTFYQTIHLFCGS